MNILENLRLEMKQNKKVFFVALFAFLFFLLSGFAVFISTKPQDKPVEDKKVLGIKVESPTSTPTPIPTIVRRVTAPTSTPTPTPSSQSSSGQAQSPTPTPTLTNTPTPTPTNTPTPTPNGLSVEVRIDYAGFVDKPAETYSITVEQGKTAWDGLKEAIGVEHIQYTNDPTYGVFISGINGVVPDYNLDKKFWLFRINGKASEVGVSAYECKNADIIEFIITGD